MKWVRCPTCRTVNDVDRYPMCDGCFADLSGVPAAEQPPRPSRAQQEGNRDSRTGQSGVRWLAIASLIGLGATFFLPVGVTLLTAVVTFVLLFMLILNVCGRGLTRARMGPIVTTILGLFAILTALIGAGILVFVACAANLSGTRLGG